MTNLVPGDQVGNYRVVRSLGQGGMGAVYEVEHVKLGVRYGLKTYTLEEGHAELFRKRFQAEGKLLARLSHPNLVRVFDLDYDEARGVLYYVMDLVLYEDGEAHTLADIEDGGADEATLFRWFTDLCGALAYVHSQGVVHRDIKLNNILLAPDGRAVLSDFGISRIMDERLRTEVDVSRTMVSGATCSSRLIMGTAGYLAPEVECGEEATAAADVYALGVAFFKLLTGIWYDTSLAPNAQTASGKLNSVQLLSHFEYAWKDVIPVMLNANPEDRPTDLVELPAYLPPQQPAEPVAEAGGKVRRVRRWRTLAALAAALALGLGAWLLLRARPEAADEGQDDILESAFEIPESVK